MVRSIYLLYSRWSSQRTYNTKNEKTKMTDNIFQDDLFNRKSFITERFYPCCKILLEKGGVLAVNAPFGFGKTKFAEYYIKYLELENKLENKPEKGVIINAFLHDYLDEPFFTIHKAIDKLFGQDSKLKKLGLEVLKAGGKEAVSLIPILRKIDISNMKLITLKNIIIYFW